MMQLFNNANFISTLILLSVLHGEIASKSISDSSEINDPVIGSKDPEPQSFKSDAQTSKELSEELSDQRAFVKIPRVSLKSSDALELTPSKHDALDAIEDGSDENRRIVKIYPNHNHRRSPFGIVYKDGKLLGILEPISRVYEYQSLQDEVALGDKLSALDVAESDASKEDEVQSFVKRNTGRLDAKQQAHDKMAALMHPQVLSSRLKAPAVAEDEDETQMDHSMTKLDKAHEHRRNVQLEDTGQQPVGPKLSAIESNLKAIISDLNTMNEDEDYAYVEKRHAPPEDEDLDNGSNRIPIAKAPHEPATAKAKKSLTAADVAPGLRHVKVEDYRTAGDSFIRQKRQQATAASHDGSDIVKGLEASGELTVSGNKSPLAEIEAKAKDGGSDESFKKRDKQAADHGDEEARVQRKITEKIMAIKEQVKREVAQKKGNLLDRADETEQFDAMRKVEGDSMTPHARKRRDASDDGDESKTQQSDMAGTAKAKREVKCVKAIAAKSAVGFQIGQNSNAIAGSARDLGARVRAPRAARSSANDVQDFDAASLKQMIDDSASLMNAVVNLHEAPAAAAEEEEEARRVRALAENHAESANLVINPSGEDEIIMKRAAGRAPSAGHRKQQRFRANGAAEATTIAHLASAADDAAATSGEEHFLVYEAAGKTNARSASKAKSAEERMPEGMDDEAQMVSMSESDASTRLPPATMPTVDGQAVSDEMTANVRLQRHSPSEAPLSVEDMQQLDSESSMKRKRREAAEEDRYRGDDDDEADEENDEFDDDNFDDRTASMVKKRAAAAAEGGDGVVYDGDEYENGAPGAAADAEYGNREPAAAIDAQTNAREYVAKLNGDVFDNANYLYDANGMPLNRNRRQAMPPRRADTKHRKKRLPKHAAKMAAGSGQNAMPIGNRNTGMAGLTENDIFGGLPQSYEGELTRFKRVKRSDKAATTPASSAGP